MEGTSRCDGERSGNTAMKRRCSLGKVTALSRPLAGGSHPRHPSLCGSKASLHARGQAALLACQERTLTNGTVPTALGWAPKKAGNVYGNHLPYMLHRQQKACAKLKIFFLVGHLEASPLTPYDLFKMFYCSACIQSCRAKAREINHFILVLMLILSHTRTAPSAWKYSCLYCSWG